MHSANRGNKIIKNLFRCYEYFSMMIGDTKIGNTKIIITDLRRNKIEVE